MPTAYMLAFLCLIAVLAAIICGAICKTDKVNNLISKHTIRTLRNNIWDDVIDFKNGCNVVIRMNDGTSYEGSADLISDDSSWLTLTQYTAYGQDDAVQYKYNNCNEQSLVMIRIDDIKDCFVVYSDGTSKSERIKTKSS